MASAVTMTSAGPLFNGQAAGIIQRETELAVKELVELGQERLAQVLRPRPGGVYLSVAEAGRGKASQGHYARNVQGYTRGLQGELSDGGVSYGAWLENGRTGTRFKGYASFRKTGQWLQKQAPKVMEEKMEKMVRDLNGV